MNLRFHISGKKSYAGRWWLGLFLLSALVFSGCKQFGGSDVAHEDSLRRDDLALPAREVRSNQVPAAAKKSPDDIFMSGEAQRVYHDLD